MRTSRISHLDTRTGKKAPSQGREGEAKCPECSGAVFRPGYRHGACKANEIFAGSHCGRVRERAEVPDTRRIGCTCARARDGDVDPRARAQEWYPPMDHKHETLRARALFQALPRSARVQLMRSDEISSGVCDNSETVLSLQNPCNKSARVQATALCTISEYNASCIHEDYNVFIFRDIRNVFQASNRFLAFSVMLRSVM